VRVSAFDPRTLAEVYIVGAAAAGHAILERMVLRRLDWVLARKRGWARVGTDQVASVCDSA